ncbi:MAG: AtpZ/AtpI family protein [Eubacteriales bacterium]|nr:AtpZ/AtpI family protein [Eubacteriales bacterium]
MKQWTDIYKNILMLTQLGLSFITPILLCLALCWYLCAHFGLGEWIYILGFFFGMGGSGMVAYKFYLSVMKKHKKEEKSKISFNRHS